MGCKNSKNTSEPGQKSGSKSTNVQSPQKGVPGAKHQSPQKGSIKFNIKPIQEAELTKHKINDIVGFVKSGNLSMVVGLLNHFKLEKGLLSLRGVGEDFQLGKNEKVNTKDWNVFLIAVANKKIELVRYFIHELKISVRHAGQQPGAEKPVTAQDSAKIQIFPLQVAIANKDLQMFEELWNQYTCWESTHLKLIVQKLVNERWNQGLTLVLKSYTTDVAFNSQSLERQAEIVAGFFHLRKGLEKDFTKHIDDALMHKPFSLISIYTLLEDTQDKILSRDEVKTFIDKAHLDISEQEYGHLKYSILNTLLRQRIAAFEQPEVGALKKLTAVFDEFDKKFQSSKYFKSEEDYNTMETDLLQAFKDGNLEKIQAIITEVDLRRIPMADGLNYLTNVYHLTAYPYLWWPVTLHMIHANQVSEQKMIEMLDYLLHQGFSIRQAFRQSDVKNTEPLNLPREPQIQGPSLLLALEKNLVNVFNYLWGQDYIEIWGNKHYSMLIDVVYQRGNTEFLNTILNSDVGQNIFLQKTDAEKHSIVKDIYSRFSYYNDGVDAKAALTNKHYAPYLLLQLIERDQFRKMTDYAQFETCLSLVSQYELEELSKTQAYEEIFMNFLRYITILDPSDPKRVEGQKLIDKIFEIEKFKAFKNQSLHILDYESMIQDEEGVAQPVQRVHAAIVPNKKHQARDFSLSTLHSLFDTKKEQEIIDYLKAHNQLDLMFIRGEFKRIQNNVAVLDKETGTFQLEEVSHSKFNILQLAVVHGMYNLVNYLLSEHQTVGPNRQVRYMDPKIIITTKEEFDETLTLRLALDCYADYSLFQRFWSYYPQLFTESHFLTVAKYALFVQQFDFLYYLLNSYTTHRIFLNTPKQVRKDFVNQFDELSLQNAKNKEDLKRILSESPYNRQDRSISGDRMDSMYISIKDNEIAQLRALIDGDSVQGIAHLTFDELEYDEEVLALADDQTITVQMLNPILLAVKAKSFSCLTYLVETFGLRQSIKAMEIIVKEDKNEYPYNSLLLPILMKTKDIQALEYLVKNEGFIFTQQDFASFVSAAIKAKWIQGLKIFLNAPSVQFFFQTLDWTEQKNFVQRTITEFGQEMDPKFKKGFFGQVEEIFAKRPYIRALLIVLVESSLPEGLDETKIATQCLRTLLSEDLVQLYHVEGNLMTRYETKYANINGESFVNVIAKIVLRYKNEAKPEVIIPQDIQVEISANQRKLVRFDEGEQSVKSREDKAVSPPAIVDNRV